jgi:hypothetical protein
MDAQCGPHPQQRGQSEQPRGRIQHPVWRRGRQHHPQQVLILLDLFLHRQQKARVFATIMFYFMG